MKHPILTILSMILTCIAVLYVTIVTGYFSGSVMYVELGGCVFTAIAAIIILLTHVRGR